MNVYGYVHGAYAKSIVGVYWCRFIGVWCLCACVEYAYTIGFGVRVSVRIRVTAAGLSG